MSELLFAQTSQSSPNHRRELREYHPEVPWWDTAGCPTARCLAEAEVAVGHPLRQHLPEQDAHLGRRLGL